jgi:uncharacterized protein
MKQFITLLALLTIYLSANAQKNFLDVNYIEVQGTANLEVIPDMIYLNIRINESDTKGKIPLNKQEQAMIEKLSSLGIDVAKDLVMEDFDSYFKRKIFVGNDVYLSKNYQLLVHDGKMSSKVMTELEAINIANVSIERIDHTKINEYKKEVRANALKAAKEKAEHLTKAVGQTIGKALYIEETNPGYIQPMYASNMMFKSASSDATPYESNIDFKKIKIESTMLVRFELK